MLLGCCRSEPSIKERERVVAKLMTDKEIDGIKFVDYEDESQLDDVMSLVGRDLSEPYSSECETTLTR